MFFCDTLGSRPSPWTTVNVNFIVTAYMFTLWVYFHVEENNSEIDENDMYRKEQAQ